MNPIKQAELNQSNKQIPQLRAAIANILLWGKVAAFFVNTGRGLLNLGIQMQPRLPAHHKVWSLSLIAVNQGLTSLVMVRVPLCSAEEDNG